MLLTRRSLIALFKSAALCAMTAALVIVPAHSASAGLTSAQGEPEPRVVGGTRALQGEFPWMVRLSMGGSDVLLRVTSGPRPQLPGSHG
jgi:secreted trypsin-like serine protease